MSRAKKNQKQDTVALGERAGAAKEPCPKKAVTGGAIYGRSDELSKAFQFRKSPMLLLKLSPPQTEMFGEAPETGTGFHFARIREQIRLHSQQPCADARRI